MKKVKQRTEHTIAELQQQLEDTKKELFALRLQKVSSKLENPLRIRAVRRSIARIQTIMNQTAKA